VVGDDEVNTKAARQPGLGKGAHAGIDADDQAHALFGGGLEDRGLDAVALAQPVRDVKTDGSAPGLGSGEHLDGGFEEDDGGGAVHVVVAVQQDGLAAGDGQFKAVYGSGHAAHPKGIVEVGKVRIEEMECGFGSDDAASQKQLRDDLRNVSFGGQVGSGLGLGGAELPALRSGCEDRLRSGLDRFGRRGRIGLESGVHRPCLAGQASNATVTDRRSHRRGRR
jgi:hypothetical protein